MNPGALVGAVAVAVSLLVVMGHPRRDAILACLVGVTGGLVAVQVANIHAFTVVVTLWWVLSPITSRGWRGAVLPLLAATPVALTAFTGDLVSNPKLSLQLIALALNAAMIVSRVTPPVARQMLLGLLAACSAASAMGLGQVAGVIPNQGWHTDVLSYGRPYAFYPEPDWLGLFAGIGLVLAWRVVPSERPVLRVALVLLNTAAWAVVQARAAWVGVAACVAVYLVARLIGRRRAGTRRSGSASLAIGITTASLAALAALPTVRADLIARISTFSNGGQPTDISGQARVKQTDGLLRLIDTAPWDGHGISASGRVGVSGIYDPSSPNSVGSNWVLSLWVDAHYLAIPLLVLLIGVALLRCLTVPGQVLVLVLVNNLFSNATFQPVTWLILGLALAATRGSSASVRDEDVGERDAHSARHQNRPQLDRTK